MKPKHLLVLLFSFLSLPGFSQTFPVTGKVTDAKDNSALPGATVMLIRLPDSARSVSITDNQGTFNFQPAAGQYLLRASFLGFQTLQRRVVVADKPIALGNLALQVNTTALKEVQITERVPTAVQKGDTTEFNAKAMKVNTDANSDELVEKVPGVVIQDGKVTARGQDVKKVRVDGKEFFGDDAMATLKNLPADVVDKIQLVEEQSEQSRLSGIDDGNRNMTMNIVTRPDRRNGTFGRVMAGAGTDERYQAGGTINIFKPKRRVTFLGGTNNINQQGFGMEDFLGGGFGGGRGNRGSGGFGGSGITTTHNAGINYSEEWGKKITLSASYFGNYTDNVGYTSSYLSYFQPELEKKSEAYETEEYGRSNTNHRLNARFEYKIDSANTLFVQPRLSFQLNNGFSNAADSVNYLASPVSKSGNNTSNDLAGYNLGTEVIYRHQFAKRGRSASVGVNLSSNENNSDTYTTLDGETYNFRTGEITYIDTDRFMDRESQGFNMGTNLSYIEPLTKTSNISLNYNYNINQNDSDTRTYDYSEADQAYTSLNRSVSNTFNNNSFSHQAGLGYNYFNAKVNFNARASYQYSELDNQRLLPTERQMTKGFVRFIPYASFQYRFTRSKNLRIFYNGNTQNPSLDQMQDVLDKTNPLALRIGNPDLDQAYQNFLNFRYTAANTEKSTTFIANISGSLTQDQIVNNRFVNNTNDTIFTIGNFFADTLINRASLSRAENLNGNYSLRSFVSYSLPLKFIKSNLNFDLSANISRTPGITTPINVGEPIKSINTFSYSQNYGAGVTLSSNISQNLDFNISTRGNYSYAYNTLSSSQKNTYYNQFSRVRFNWVIYKGVVFNTDFTHRLNTTVVEGGSNINYLMWNMSIGKKLFKKQNGDIRLSVYDALRQNQGFQQNVNNNYLQETQSVVLQRYLMLTFTYNIRKFGNGSGNAPAPGERDGMRERGRFGPGGPGGGPGGGGWNGGGRDRGEF
ncbi:collagen-binding protein [Adhaeribacter aerolatus]|uniref:Collagen-binding protein n=1 Tax=Adhaeribacter aerolatus TaxID=670289 RepID=A0A512B3P8_9BACT|nr:TonB-dependent receptor [Adhaeribacter aerolatus]GEO06589.1 collagen-binding protein [Adhaeribacter aerolatus]